MDMDVYTIIEFNNEIIKQINLKNGIVDEEEKEEKENQLSELKLDMAKREALRKGLKGADGKIRIPLEILSKYTK